MLCWTLQVAEQQGKYLARTFNALAKDPNAKIGPFSYKHMGSMASIGKYGNNMKNMECRTLPHVVTCFEDVYCVLRVAAQHSNLAGLGWAGLGWAVLSCAVLSAPSLAVKHSTTILLESIVSLCDVEHASGELHEWDLHRLATTHQFTRCKLAGN